MKDHKDLLKDVQNALANGSPFAESFARIYVLVKEGAVILAGSVDNTLLKNLALKFVNAVPGVSIVIDDLKIDPSPRHRLGVQIDWTNGQMMLRP
jgi:osmotically-inducible protein OsmY